MNWSQADIRDAHSVRRLLRIVRPQIVFHLAGHVTGQRDLTEVIPTFQTNLASTIYLLVAMVEQGCERAILAGSCESPAASEVQTPCSPYSASKWSVAAYADMFRALFPISIVVPRIFITYGPGLQDTRKIIPYTILSMLRGERPKLGNGRRMVDWIYIDDVIEGLIRAAFATHLVQDIFDLGSGALVSIRSLVSRIAEMVGNGAEADFGALPERLLEHERVADTGFLEHTFGWKPATSLDEGLKNTVEWFRSRHANVARAS